MGFSCEMEDLAEPHVSRLCVFITSRLILRVCPHHWYRSATPLGTSLYQGEQGDVDQYVHGKYTTRWGGQTLAAVKCTRYMYALYVVEYRRGGGGACTQFVHGHSSMPLDPRIRSRVITVPTTNSDTSNMWALITICFVNTVWVPHPLPATPSVAKLYLDGFLATFYE